MRDHPPASFDVAISGAGLAGSALAAILAKAGASVAVLDPGTFPRDKLCGEFLSPESWGTLDRMGVAHEVRRSGFHEVHSVRISTPRGREIVADITGPDGLPGIALGRSFLDDLLVRHARSAGATVMEKARVTGAILRDGQASGLRARHPERGLIEVSAAVTIAADGRHSALVKETGSTRGRGRLPTRPRFFGMKRHLRAADPAAIASDSDPASERPGTVGLHVVPGGYGGTCRVEGGVTNLCAMLPESEVRSRRGDLDAVARESLGRNPVLRRLWEASEPAGDWKAVSGVRVEVSSPRCPGILYAGDARGTVDPLGGQGMTMALLGAEALAPFVLSGLRDGSVNESLQLAWDRAWHARFDRRVNLCRAFHHFLVRPFLLDSASSLGPLASRMLSVCYRGTRDSA